MAKLRVKDIAYRLTDDIDFTRVAHSKEWDKLANVCVGQATNALKNPRVYTGPSKRPLSRSCSAKADPSTYCSVSTCGSSYRILPTLCIVSWGLEAGRRMGNAKKAAS